MLQERRHFIYKEGVGFNENSPRHVSPIESNDRFFYLHIALTPSQEDTGFACVPVGISQVHPSIIHLFLLFTSRRFPLSYSYTHTEPIDPCLGHVYGSV